MTHRLTCHRLLLLVVLLGTLATLALVAAVPVRAQSSTSTTGGGTVLICEATGNPNAPYVEVDVPQSDLGNYSAAAGDIIPAPASGCPAMAAGQKKKNKHPHPKPVHRTPTPTPSPLTTTPPPAAEPAPPASVSEPAAAASSPHTLPMTGGHTPITVVLGLLLLYCGVVVRWAASGPRPGAPRLGEPPR